MSGGALTLCYIGESPICLRLVVMHSIEYPRAFFVYCFVLFCFVLFCFVFSFCIEFVCIFFGAFCFEKFQKRKIFFFGSFLVLSYAPR